MVLYQEKLHQLPLLHQAHQPASSVARPAVSAATGKYSTDSFT